MDTGVINPRTKTGYKYARAVCERCGREYMVTREGEIRSHPKACWDRFGRDK